MRYVDLIKTDNGLTITLLPEGGGLIAELVERWGDGYLSSDAAFYYLLKWQCCNGWEWIQPREIGALTDAPILADDVLPDDDGELVDCFRVYWWERYQILAPARELRDCGSIQLLLAN